MATFALIHGGGGSAWGWRFVAEKLEALGHETVAMDLPCDDPEAGWQDYSDTVVKEIREEIPGREIVVVSHSAGGFVAPLVCERIPAKLMVFVAGMIPTPGETFMEWWGNTGYGDYATEYFDDLELFYNGVASDLAAGDAKRGEGREHFPEKAWPMEAWPDVPTKYILFRDDRLFPPDFARKVAGERLGIAPEEIEEVDGGHCAILSHPEEIAGKLDEICRERDHV